MTETSQPATAAAAKSAAKKPPAAVVVAAAPAKKIALYSIDTRDTYAVAYYEQDDISYAEVAVYVNGVVPEGTYRFTVALDGMSIMWERATHKRVFDKKLLQGLMRGEYSSSHSRVIAYDNAFQEMLGNGVTPDPSKLYWGSAQVIKLKEKVTGTPVFGHHPYPTKTKIKEQTQFNTLVHCRVKLAKQRVEATAKTHYDVIDLFNLASSQESYDDDRRPPPFSPPPQKCKRDARNKRPPFSYDKCAAAGKRGGYSEVSEERDYDYGEDRGGKRGN